MLRDPDIESTAGTGAPSMTEASAPAAPAPVTAPASPPPGTATPAGAEQTDDAAEDAILASMGIGGKAEQASGTGQQAPAEQKAVEPPKPATARLASLDTPDKRGEYLRAVRNLQWTGLSQTVIDKMDVADVLAEGKTAAQRRATLDRQRSRRDAEPRPAETDSPPASRGRNQEAQPRSQPARDEQTGRFERSSESDDSDPLDDLLDLEADAVEPPARRRDPEAEELRRENEATKRELHETWVEGAFRSVEGSFPQIKDPAHMKRVADRMAELDPDRGALKKGKAAVAELVKQACWFEYGDQIIQDRRAATQQDAQSLRDGQPHNTTGRNRQEKPPTIEDIEDAAADAVVESNGDVDAARRRLNQRLGT